MRFFRSNRSTAAQEVQTMRLTARIIAAPACALFIAAGCGPAVGGAGGAGQPAPGTGTALGAGMGTNADLWATSTAAWQGGVAGARMALEHTQDPGLRTFAQGMVNEWGTVDQRFGGVLRQHNITATPGTTAQQLQRAQQQATDAFRGYQGRDFDRVWLDHQIATHRWMLDSIDRSYLPAAAGNAALQQELRTQRELIQRNLQEAERIRGGWR
jgi:predicted outer membrane protein